MTLKEARNNIGKWVVYEPFANCPIGMKETGIITSVNDTYVFVKYKNELHSKATRPEQLKV